MSLFLSRSSGDLVFLERKEKGFAVATEYTPTDSQGSCTGMMHSYLCLDSSLYVP